MNPQSESQLLEIIQDGKNLITSSDCEGYFRNMNRYIRRSINEEVIND